MQEIIYLDNSSTTQIYKEVSDYITETMNDNFGNPSSLHTLGIKAENAVKESRNIISKSLNCSKKEVYFTSGGTESNNLAIFGYLAANPRAGRHIITSQIEHPSVINAFENLKESGYEVDYVGVDECGIIRLDELKALIRKDTALLSIMYANNEIGAIQPIEEIVKIRDSIKKDLCIHVDAVQAYGKIKVHPKRLGIQMMSVSSHKIHGPMGSGALFIDESIKVKPIIFGGGQERNLRSGSENVPAIAGFGLAAKIMNKSIDENYKKVLKLNKIFKEKLNENFNDIKFNSCETSLPYILNVSFYGVKAEVLLHHLEAEGIFVSTGSACSEKRNLQSRVLKAIGLSKNQSEGAIRFSFSSENNEDEINKTIEALGRIIPGIKNSKFKGDER